MSIGTEIKRVRESLNMTQQDLADKVGTSQSSVAQMERDRIVPLISTLSRYAEALNVSIGDLLAEELKIVGQNCDE